LRTDESLQIFSFRSICSARTRICYGLVLVNSEEARNFRRIHQRATKPQRTSIWYRNKSQLVHRRQAINEVKIASFLHE
jgi:hypothetical protein